LSPAAGGTRLRSTTPDTAPRPRCPLRCRIPLLLAALLIAAPAYAGPRALFDNAHAETAGNADWQIDTHQPTPSPDQALIVPSTPRTYWVGAISSWGVDLVKRGYTVATNTTALTYQNLSNPYDLSKYDVLIVDEPNTLFTAAEASAILSFVHDGGGLVAVADHYVSDRNGDGFDSPMIWNALDPTHLLGVHCGVSGDPNNNISTIPPSTNVNPSLSDSLTHGPVGVVTGFAFHNGTTFTIFPAANPTVRGEVWMTGVSQSSLVSVMAASSAYGSGRFFIAGDSSPADDGSAAPGNSSIFDGWGETGATDSTLFMNATLWATRRTTPADLAAPVVTLSAPAGGESWKAGSTHAITWTATDNVGVTAIDLAYSTDGGATFPYAIATGITNSGTTPWSVPNTPGVATRVRVTAHDLAGNTGLASGGNFTIDTWTITATSGAGGGIAPSGAVAVVQGASQGFTITPAANHHVLDVLVDGASVGPPASYAFTSVAANHAIDATFSANAYALTVSLAGSGTVARSPDLPGYPYGTSVDLMATADPGWVFSGWSGDTAATADTIALAITGSRSVTATFVLDVLGVEGGAAVLALAPPAPNPGHSSALLRFSLPAEARVGLEILDLSGRRVGGYEAELCAGAHAWRWDGNAADGARVGAGLYFVRLVTPWGTLTRRLAWLR
jgi:hypothetical protein